MSTYTPGPWHLSESAHQPLQSGVCSDDGLHITDVNGYGMTDKQNNANARLIAASPDMYEALKTANDLLNEHYGIRDNDEAGSTAHDVIRYAIAKAEGRVK